MLLLRRRRCGSIVGGVHGPRLLNGMDLFIILGGAIVNPAGTELRVLCQEGVWLLVLVAADGDGASGEEPLETEDGVCVVIGWRQFKSSCIFLKTPRPWGRELAQ